MRKFLAVLVACAAIGGPVALGARPSQADVAPVADAAVSLQVAQATANSVGQTTINWQSSATVTPAKGTLLRARIDNVGLVPLFSETLTVNPGAKLAPNFTIDPACTVTTGATSDTVTCTYGSLAAGASTPYVYVPATMPSTGTITSTASTAASPDGVVQLTPDANDSASVTSTAANSGYAFVTDGQSATFHSADAKVDETFSVPTGATKGGGVFVRLYEGDASDTTCGTTTCYTPEARADFVQVGGTPATVDNPFRIAVGYATKQTCNGLGYGSSCNPIFYLKTGQTAGVAQLVQKCTSGYSSNNPNATGVKAIPDPCVYSLGRHGDLDTDDPVTYYIALLDDIGFPIPVLGGK
ncbi:MAG: hypothetical protein QOJ09_168 [Actinomycetota bacterium]|jgi:hypothetical protein|nr:hypothetical protein [Actinomycetota bacterium]